MTNSPIQPPMSMDEMHRSLPLSPCDTDSRGTRAMGTPFDPRPATDGPDYFSAMGPLDHRTPGGPFPQPGFDPDMTVRGGQGHIDELVRRTNLLVQFVNGQIPPAARYSQLQPKMCSNGKFPSEFGTPRTMEEIRAIDPSTLERILRAYGLPIDLRSLRLTSRDKVNPRTAHQARLCTLFDFLGAAQISERLRMKWTVCLPY